MFCCCNHIELPHGLNEWSGFGSKFNPAAGSLYQEYLLEWQDYNTKVFSALKTPNSKLKNATHRFSERDSFLLKFQFFWLEFRVLSFEFCLRGKDPRGLGTIPEKENRKLEGPRGLGTTRIVRPSVPWRNVLHKWVNQAVLFMGEPFSKWNARSAFPSDELGIYCTFIMNNSYHKSTRNRMWKNLSRAPKTSVMSPNTDFWPPLFFHATSKYAISQTSQTSLFHHTIDIINSSFGLIINYRRSKGLCNKTEREHTACFLLKIGETSNVDELSQFDELRRQNLFCRLV